MAKSIHKSILIFGLCLLLLGWTSSLWAQVQFKARLLTGGGPNVEAAINVRINIKSYTDADEVRQLLQVYNSGGEDAFWPAFYKIDKGSVIFFGGLGMNISFHAAYEKSTDKGFKIILFSKSHNIDPGSKRLIYGGFLFLVVELDLDKNYRGEGKVFEDARIRFTEQSTIEMESYTRAPKTLVGVSLVK
ncbi:MAG: hypothetical protein NTV82_09145 [Candidatus Aminicenantes bacterium]|nr:hypothetical protein [Candidatus Aminicenantes bacterium]